MLSAMEPARLFLRTHLKVEMAANAVNGVRRTLRIPMVRFNRMNDFLPFGICGKSCPSALLKLSAAGEPLI